MSLKPRPVNFDETWQDLRRTVKEVITLGNVKRTIWNESFGDVYSLCVAYPQPLADKLYAETKQFLEAHVLNILSTQVAGSQSDASTMTTVGNGDGIVPADAVVTAAAAAAERTVTVDADMSGTLLQRYFDAWTEYSQGIQFLNYLYLYLNQQHIKKQKLTDAEFVYGSAATSDSQHQMEIGDLGLDIWRQHMIQSLRDALVRQLLDAIRADRCASNSSSSSNSANNTSGTSTSSGTGSASQPSSPGNSSSGGGGNGTGGADIAATLVHSVPVIHGVIQSFVTVQEYRKKSKLKMYQDIFETPMLEATSEYYRAEAAALLQQCTVSQYMEEVIKRLTEEQRRAQRFLHASSVPKVRKQCEDRMISDHLEFLHSECKEMVAQDRRDDLRNMYTLLKPIPDGLKTLIQALLDHIKNEGIETIATLKGDTVHVQFVENMLQVHGKYEQLIAGTFRNDPLFLSALDKACSVVINKRLSEKQPCRSAELVAKYCDTLLKKSKSTEAEIDAKLSASITIFKYIEDKDVYQKFYSRMLAKRLIHELSQSMDAEEAMINRLKQACGYEFTNKLHRMFTDISVSLDLNNKFGMFLRLDDHEIGINLAIKVLQAGAWPLGPTQVVIPFAVPQEFEKSINMFEKFYHVSFSGRKLTWLHHLCHGELKVTYLKKPYIITMQTYQMAMLLLFETVDAMSCKEMQETLQLNDDTFQKHVQSLLESKLLVAGAEPLEPAVEIRLNMDYSNKRTKFKISAALQKETQQEVEHTMSAVDDDRKLYLQAAIVRIMKSRKILKHNALIQEILSQSKVSFAPSISMIKKCIESLIDKQYIERTPSVGDEYSYVA